MRASEVLLCTTQLQCPRGKLQTLIDARLVRRLSQPFSEARIHKTLLFQRRDRESSPSTEFCRVQWQSAAKPQRDVRTMRKRCFCHFGRGVRAQQPFLACGLKGRGCVCRSNVRDQLWRGGWALGSRAQAVPFPTAARAQLQEKLAVRGRPYPGSALQLQAAGSRTGREWDIKHAERFQTFKAS